MLLKREDFDGVVWVFNRTCGLLSEHWIKILRSIWVLVLISLLLELAPFMQLFLEFPNKAFDVYFFRFLLISPLFLGVLWVIIAMRVYRLMLTPENLDIVPFGPMTNAASYFRFTTRAVLFFAISGLLFSLPFIVLFYFIDHSELVVTALQAAAVLIAIYGLWIIAPLYLALPSIAIRQVMNFHDVAGLSFNHRVLMFCAITVIPLLSILFANVLEAIWKTDHYYLIAMVTSVVYVFSLVVEIVILSVSFAYIMHKENEDEIIYEDID